MKKDVDFVDKNMRIPYLANIYKVLGILIDNKENGITAEEIHFKARMSFSSVISVVIPFLKVKGFAKVIRRDGRSRNVFVTPVGEMFYYLIKDGSKFYDSIQEYEEDLKSWKYNSVN